MNCFVPEMRQPSPSGTAVVRSAPASDPEPASVSAKAPIFSPRASGGTNPRRCSSVREKSTGGSLRGGQELPANLVQHVLAVAEGVDDDRVELLALLGDDLVPADAPALRVAVRPVVRDRVDRIGDREDAGPEGDLLTGEPVGITGAVPA